MPTKGGDDLPFVDSCITEDENDLRCSVCWRLFPSACARKVARKHVRKHIEQGFIAVDQLDDTPVARAIFHHKIFMKTIGFLYYKLFGIRYPYNSTTEEDKISLLTNFADYNLTIVRLSRKLSTLN